MATDDDVNVTSSASISCSPTTRSRPSPCDVDDDVNDDVVGLRGDRLHHRNSFAISVHRITPAAAARKNPGDDRLEVLEAGQESFDVDQAPASPTSTSAVSSSSRTTDDVHDYIELTTDCSTTAVHPDTDNSTC